MSFVTDNFVGTGGVSGLTGGSVSATGINRYAFFAVYAEGVTISSIAYGAQTPTAISGATVNPYGDIWQIYGLANPATGSQTPSVTFSGVAPRCVLYTILFDDVGSLGSPTVQYVESTISTLSASSSAGQTVLDFIVAAEVTITQDGTQTLREQQNNWDSVFRSFGCSSKTAAGASTTMQWTPSGNCDMFHIALPFSAAGGGGGASLSNQNILLLGVG